ncbi:MAG TPA: hypothetical protein ENK91_06205 [Bacteroidetes bacterium]|nr:hypothetical protein [Bacteroidota bacterium]
MATVLTGCCLVDHTKTIEKVAEPMLKELQQFYKEHQRFPTTKERDIMLKRSGCKMKGDVCFFEGEELMVTESEKITNGDYYMVIEIWDNDIKNIRKKSIAHCGFLIYEKSGLEEYVMCVNRPCIEWRQ